jgi:hypothetical protein
MALAGMEYLMANVEYDTNGGCWLWGKSLFRGGYGKLSSGKNAAAAHREMWALTNGDPGSLYVLHRCDVRCCINPDHLFLGTHTDNMRDMARKGRGQPHRGATNGNAKVSEATAKAIIARWRPSVRGKNRPDSAAAIAREFGVSVSAAYFIATGRSWAHLQPAKDGAAAPPQAPVAGSEDSASEVAG